MNRFQARILIAILCLITVRAVAAAPAGTTSVAEAEARAAQAHFRALGATDSPVGLPVQEDDLEEFLNRAEARTTPEGRAILQTGRAMIRDRVVVIGSCWDFIQAVYNRAGYPTKLRTSAFKGKFKTGPYANPSDLQPGDWLYYINHSYGNGEHSGIFVDWTDFATREALILSYRGENSAVPGRYSLYDLSHVYMITRPKSEPSMQQRQNQQTDSTLSRIDAMLRQ